MKQFRFETEMQVIQTIEYHIEAESLEEATKILSSGLRRGEGTTLDIELYKWETEVITVKEEFETNQTKQTVENDKVTCKYCDHSWYKYQKDVGMNVYECEKCTNGWLRKYENN